MIHHAWQMIDHAWQAIMLAVVFLADIIVFADLARAELRDRKTRTGAKS
jgi:hypothetical protein